MTSEELTAGEKAESLGIGDGKATEGDYDADFYEKMMEIAPLGVDEVDDRVRRAILRYMVHGIGPVGHEEVGGLVMMSFVHGYMVGRKLKKDITRTKGVRGC